MRIFENTQQAYELILQDIKQFGRVVKSITQQDKTVAHTDKWWSKELTGYAFSVADDSDCLKTAKDPEWCQEEFKERINLIPPYGNPGKAWKMRYDYWKDYLVKKLGDKFHYTYNERMGPALVPTLKLLKANPGTRQAVIPIFWPDDMGNQLGVGRIPCSMFYQLMIRDEKMHLMYVMRSSDYFEHFKNDFTLACLLRQFFAEELNYENGNTMMVVSSLHAYKKDLDKYVGTNLFSKDNPG